ncbi:MAG: helix-turn-helix domain-containing protein [Rikenellaceae bacterium]
MSEVVRLEFKLIGRTIYVSMIMILVGLFSASFFSYPMWMGFVFMGYFVGGAIYIYVCYHKILYSNINSLIPVGEQGLDIVDEQMADEINIEDLSAWVISDEVKSHIEAHLQRWVDRKEFLLPDATLNSAAQKLFTNRTYLSRYINMVYNCSFKTWVTQQRIEESKRLMSESPARPISQIAKQTGFTSMTSFSHLFTRYEGVTPSRWREKNLR